MPSDAIVRLRARLDRAYTHLQDLQREERAFVASEAYSVVLQANTETGEGTARLIMETNPPARLSLIIGDCIHNLRSTLDHMAWQLAVRNVGKPARPRDIRFPIHLRESGPPEPSFRTAGMRALREVLPESVPVFESFQPYHRVGDPEGHPLWVLDTLWNWDKHRQLHLVGTLSRDSNMRVLATTGRVSDIEVYDGLLKDGAILGRWRASPPDAHVKLKGDHTFHIVFDEAGPARGGITIDTLGHIHDHISRVVLPRFERFLR